MGRDEAGTLAAPKALRQEVVDPAVANHGGRIFKTTGDGLLLDFPSVVNAVRCAVDVQAAMATRWAPRLHASQQRTRSSRSHLRAGPGFGFDMLHRSGKFVIVGLFGGDATFARVSMPFRMAAIPGLLCRLIAGIPLVRAGRIDGMPHATWALKAANDVLKELRQSWAESCCGRSPA